MARWTVREDQGDWEILKGGRAKKTTTSERARNAWLQSHCEPGDKIFLQEPDGYLTNIANHVLK